MSQSACLFPGQGAQFVGMGRGVVEQCPATRRLFDEAREILGYDLAEICFNGPAEELNKTNVSQPALYVCSLAALEMLRQQSPDIVAAFTCAAGLSLGEYTALVFAGVMSSADGLKVVKVRGEAMQAAAEANPSGMVSALMLKPEQIEQVRTRASAAGRLWIANYLCPGNTVLSGEQPACDAAVTAIEAAGGKPIPLAVAGAFHTPLMESACPKLEAALRNVAMQPPRIPVISNVDAQSHSDPEEIRQLLVRQVVQPVRWEDSMRSLIAQGVTSFTEVGPGKVLKGLLKRIDRKLECASVGEA
ncbi:MAG: ACP S-malonyltransferase [Planctomycetaceae bacterium]|nr:ACP S-malonyltransferase [Planctomycetaceae bacterium]